MLTLILFIGVTISGESGGCYGVLPYQAFHEASLDPHVGATAKKETRGTSEQGGTRQKIPTLNDGHLDAALNNAGIDAPRGQPDMPP